MALTPKQEKFCQCIVSGMSAKDSYISAYNTKATEKVIYNESAKILAREDVRKRIEELRKPLENHARLQALSEREKKKEIIWKRIDICMENNDDAAVARYMDILNKMDQEYININRNIEDTTEIKELDTDTLIKLVNVG